MRRNSHFHMCYCKSNITSAHRKELAQRDVVGHKKAKNLKDLCADVLIFLLNVE